MPRIMFRLNTVLCISWAATKTTNKVITTTFYLCAHWKLVSYCTLPNQSKHLSNILHILKSSRACHPRNDSKATRRETPGFSISFCWPSGESSYVAVNCLQCPVSFALALNFRFSSSCQGQNKQLLLSSQTLLETLLRCCSSAWLHCRGHWNEYILNWSPMVASCFTAMVHRWHDKANLSMRKSLRIRANWTWDWLSIYLSLLLTIRLFYK